MPYVSSIERIGWQEGKQEGRQQERQEIIRNVLSGRFSAIDEELEAIIALLSEISTAEFSNLLLPLATLSREELVTRFGKSTLH